MVNDALTTWFTILNYKGRKNSASRPASNNFGRRIEDVDYKSHFPVDLL